MENARRGEINMSFRVNDLLLITKKAQQATDVQIYLKRKDNRPYISWKLDSEVKRTKKEYKQDDFILINL